MSRFSNLIRAVFRRRGNHPEYLDVSQLNERMRIDLGLLPMTDAERLGAVRRTGAFQPERAGCDWRSISLARRRLT